MWCFAAEARNHIEAGSQALTGAAAAALVVILGSPFAADAALATAVVTTRATIGENLLPKTINRFHKWGNRKRVQDSALPVSGFSRHVNSKIQIVIVRS
jgi:hypothetical protein